MYVVYHIKSNRLLLTWSINTNHKGATQLSRPGIRTPFAVTGVIRPISYMCIYILNHHLYTYINLNLPFRLIINTKSNLLLYNFEAVEWDYGAPAERESDFVRKTSSLSNEHRKHSHAFNRAQSARRKGTDLMNANASSASPYYQMALGRSNRVQSAPVRKTDSQGIQKHISRIQSAVAARKQTIKEDDDPADFLMRQALKENWKKGRSEIKSTKNRAVKNAWETVPDNGLLNEKSEIVHHKTTSNGTTAMSRVITRSRSAPAHRVLSLPPNERGFTTSSEVNVRVWENKLNCKPTSNKTKLRPFSASVTAMQHPVEMHSDLKLKTFYQQLQFENSLAGRG